jgi:hypothetical protein
MPGNCEGSLLPHVVYFLTHKIMIERMKNNNATIAQIEALV